MRAALLLSVPLLAVGCLGRTAVRRTAGPEQSVAQGREALRDGRYLDAAMAFEHALELDRSNLAAHRGLAHAYFELGRLPELEDRYRSALARDPDDPWASYGLAIVRYARSTAHAKEALQLLARVDALHPGLADVAYRMGLIHLDAEAWRPAADALGRAVALDGRNATYRVAYAVALYHLGEKERAIDALADLLELSPTPAEVEKARQVAARITDPLREVPESVKERVKRGLAWLEQADVPQNAIDILRDVLLEHPDLAIVHSYVGLAYQRIGSAAEALTHLRRAVELKPDLPLAHLYLGNFYYGRDRFEEAKEHYEEALRHNPLLLEAHVLLARMAMEHDDRPRALRHLRAWATLEPENPTPLLELARVLARSGELDGAQRALRRVLHLDPDNLEAHLSLATIWRRRYELARDEASRRAAAAQVEAHAGRVLEAQPDNAAAARLIDAVRGGTPAQAR
ncbi:MAG: tetratricopeptide repeat protein [Deltaproteobacteria bacterium]|nr:MAG: tetratricopeptide repeat protein [Deltaproteobacteria bacterium]